MLIHENKHDGYEACVYDSENIFKSVYYQDKKVLMVYFVRKRKSKEPSEDAKDKRKLLSSDGSIYLCGSVYSISNMDMDSYLKFKQSDSQGKHYNAFIANNPKFYKSGDYSMMASELEALLEESGKKAKGWI